MHLGFGSVHLLVRQSLNPEVRTATLCIWLSLCCFVLYAPVEQRAVLGVNGTWWDILRTSCVNIHVGLKATFSKTEAFNIACGQFIIAAAVTWPRRRRESGARVDLHIVCTSLYLVYGWKCVLHGFVSLLCGLEEQRSCNRMRFCHMRLYLFVDCVNVKRT